MQANTLDEEIKLSVGLVGWNRTVTVLRQRRLQRCSPLREQVQLMVQSMLQDRFQLKPHFETRELPVYDLVVGKDGSKIKRSADQTPPPPITTAPPRPCSL